MKELVQKSIQALAEGNLTDKQHDIWDGKFARSFKDSSSQPFFQYSGPELQLLFGFDYDGFNPFHMKAAGKKGTVGVIFLFCYNLPPDIRLQPENVFIFGIIPGPKSL